MSTESRDNQVPGDVNEESNMDGYGDNSSICDADAKSLADESEDITQPSENVTPSQPSANVTISQASCVTDNLNTSESTKQSVSAKGETNQSTLKRKYEIKTNTYQLHLQKQPKVQDSTQDVQSFNTQDFTTKFQNDIMTQLQE